MKNKDIIEWMLDEGIDPLTKVNTKDGEIYLSDILEKHLIEQLRIHDVVGQSEQLLCPECLSNRVLEHKDKYQCRLCWNTWAK